MGKLSGTLTFDRNLARKMLADLERGEDQLTSKKRVSTRTQVLGMPVRVKQESGRATLYIGVATNKKATHSANITKTAEEQIHTRALMDRIVSKAGNVEFQVPSVALSKSQSLKDEDVQAGSRLQTESGETFSVMSFAEVKARLVRYDHESAIKHILETEVPTPQTLAEDMLIYEKADDHVIQKLVLTCQHFSPAEYENFMGLLLKQPEKLYAFRRVLAAGLGYCTPPSSSQELIAMQKLYKQAGESGTSFLQTHMSNLPYAEALTVFNSLSSDIFLGRAARSAMVSHMALAAGIHGRNADSFENWGSQCKELLQVCQKSSDPAFLCDEDELNELVHSSDVMMGKLERLLEAGPGPSFGDIGALPVSALNKLFQKVCIDNPGHSRMKDIAEAWENKIYEYGLGGQDRASQLVLDAYGSIPRETGNDTVETGELVKEYKTLPRPVRAGNYDLNNEPEFRSRAAPVFRDIPTPVISAVKNADGESIYPGSTVAMPYGNYLALQGPTEDNYGQFWDVILDNKANVSVSLTKEGEIEDPFPSEESENPYGDHTVKNIKTRTLIPGRLEVHYLLIDGKTPHVRVCMRNWTDMTGSNPAILAATAAVVKSFHQGMGTVAVNCRAGVGRTCTYIGVSEDIMAAMNSEPVLPVVDKVALMRGQRGSTGVQKPAQLQTLKVANQYARELAMAFKPVASVY